MGIIATSKSPLLNPDRNLPLNKILRWTVYSQFCAGVNRDEVLKTVAEVKKMGFQGIILGYSKEIVLDHDEMLSTDESGTYQYSDKCYQVIEDWKEGTLETLRMVGPGDFLGVK